MKRITLIILAVAAVLAGGVSCQKASDIEANPLPTMALSIIPNFSDGSVYSFSDDGSFFLKVTVTPKAYIEKLTNTDSFICKADFRSVITKATPENPDFTVVGKITSASVEEGYMTASFTLSEVEMGKMLEADYMVSFSTEDADGVHGASTPFVFVSWCARDGRGGNIVNFDGHKAVRLAGLYWATENINDYASCERFHGDTFLDMCFFNQLNEKTDNYDSSNNNALNAARSWGDGWTLPSKENWQDLIDYCKWTSLEEGWLVEGKSEYGEDGNSIFLPFRTRDYWAKDMYCLSRIPNVITAPASNYLSVRPVVRGITSVVFGITMNSPSIVVEMGATSTLTVNGSPSSNLFVALGSNRMFQWSSSNPDVASVDIDGKVTGVYAGEATITAKFREFTATCEVTVFSNAVDLGLSVKWASMNLGAYAPEASGDYYAWGATTTNPDGNYSWSNCPYCSDSYGEKFNKYVPMGKMSYWGRSGQPDNKKVLEPGDDAAVAKLGGKWRTPTSAEFEELFKSCDTEWTTVNNVNGLKFTSRTNGNSIFLPATGHRDGYNLIDEGEEGLYMSSSLATDIPDHAMSFEIKIRSEYASTIAKKRNMGLTIRAVTE